MRTLSQMLLCWRVGEALISIHVFLYSFIYMIIESSIVFFPGFFKFINYFNTLEHDFKCILNTVFWMHEYIYISTVYIFLEWHYYCVLCKVLFLTCFCNLWFFMRVLKTMIIVRLSCLMLKGDLVIYGQDLPQNSCNSNI